ncbi:hypothetical protein BUALT_Bualt14G0080000 [Buddleja alternifolia]|uniref:F-box protein n=1 Tax=Buddleja alternifolia TaxID=168488 RepID=A0AAV6WG00_9LAMI|nr:hypothetical protein BUALT_Bualt14G0080000 [Buddleja alternifolia]
MEEGKTVESMDGEIQLPEVTIQHIQSFLDRRQAARTIVLSKSWHSEWSTPPSLLLVNVISRRFSPDPKLLNRSRVSIGDDMITGIMLGCPSLQNLHLLECNGLLNVNASKLHKVEKFSVTKCRDCNLTFVWVDVPEYCKLSCLILEQVKIDDFFFHDFSLKFPCLEDLSLHHCDGYNNIEISRGSLKYISLMHKYELKKAKFEVPNICKFKFSAFSIPSLSFMTPSREYESYISFTFTRWSSVVGDCWYLDLKKLLTELSRSRTSLSITMRLDKWEYRVGNNRGYLIPVVENLMIKIYPSTRLWSAVFDDVFWSCRPKFITFCGKLPFNFLVQQASQDCSGSTQKLSYTNDLEEVNVEFLKRLSRTGSLCPGKLS